jgi:1,4-dihydroxy-2-naphthoate octaprenyltransferase
MTKIAVSKLDRGVAVGLAIIFIAAGITGIVMGVAKYQWLLVLIGLVSIWWGSVWTRVAVKGRRLQFSEILWPFLRR